MQLTPDAIYEAAMNLPENERLDLAGRLLDTVPSELDLLSLDDPNLIEELDRRRRRFRRYSLVRVEE